MFGCRNFRPTIAVAAVSILDRAGGADFRRRVKTMIDYPLPLPVEAESGAEAPESGESFLVDDKSSLEAESFTPGFPEIAALVAGAVMRDGIWAVAAMSATRPSAVYRGKRDCSPAADFLLCRRGDSRGIEVLVLQQQAFFAEIERMAVRAAEHVEA